MKFFILILLFSINCFAYKGILEANKVRGSNISPNYLINGDFDIGITKGVSNCGSITSGSSTGALSTCSSITPTDLNYGKAISLLAQTGNSIGSSRTTYVDLTFETIPFTTANTYANCYITGFVKAISGTSSVVGNHSYIEYTVDGVATRVYGPNYFGGASGWEPINMQVKCGTSSSTRTLRIAANALTLSASNQNVTIAFDELKFVIDSNGGFSTHAYKTPLLTFFTATNTGAVTENISQDLVNANGVVSDTSLFTYTLNTNYYVNDPTCWAELNDIDPAAADQKATVTQDTTSTIVVRTVSNGVKTALAHKVFCLGNR